MARAATTLERVIAAARARLGRLRRVARTGIRAVVSAIDRVRPPSLEQRFARLERPIGGRLHVAATNLADGRNAAFRAQVAVPLASTVKLALAVEVLASADAGRVALDAPVVVRARHGLLGEGALDVRFRDEAAVAVTRTVNELLHLSLVESDNTATDRLFAVVGGPSVVQRRVEQLGVRGMRIDRTIGEMFAERRRLREIAGGDLVEGSRAFLRDSCDTTTPTAMVQLLAAIHAGAGLFPASAKRLLSLMSACSTSATRIRAGVPPGAQVAHKTGTLPREVTADVGLVTMPSGVTIAVAVYVVGSVAPFVERDRAIAGAVCIAVAAVT